MTLADSEFDRRARGIRLAVFDVDGVLTDGRLTLDEAGRESKSFHSRDGLGLKALMHEGIGVALITARTSRIVEIRAAELGIERVMQGREDKAAALSELLAASSLDTRETCYAGDDLVDWPVLQACALSMAPADADGWIRSRVDYVAPEPGGRGAVRAMCERLLLGRGQLDAFRQRFEPDPGPNDP